MDPEGHFFQVLSPIHSGLAFFTGISGRPGNDLTTNSDALFQNLLLLP